MKNNSRLFLMCLLCLAETMPLQGCLDIPQAQDNESLRLLEADPPAGGASDSSPADSETAPGKGSLADGTMPLSILSFRPSVATDAVPLDSGLEIVFNQPPNPIEKAALGRSWFERIDAPGKAAGTPVPVVLKSSERGVTFYSELQPDSWYLWRYPEELWAAERYLWFFRTAWATSGAELKIIASNPQAGEVAVPPEGVLKIIYNKAIHNASLEVECASAKISGQVFSERSGMIWSWTPDRPMPGMADCILNGSGGFFIPFRTRVQIGQVGILAVNTDPLADWSCSAGLNCIPFAGHSGDGTISISDEYIVLVNGTSVTVDLRNWHIRFMDTTPEDWVLGSAAEWWSRDTGSSPSALAPGAILVLGNPPGSMNNSGRIELLNPEQELIDWLEIEDGPLWTDMNRLRRPGGSAAAGADQEEMRRLWTAPGVGYWAPVTAKIGLW